MVVGMSSRPSAFPFLKVLIHFNSSSLLKSSVFIGNRYWITGVITASSTTGGFPTGVITASSTTGGFPRKF